MVSFSNLVESHFASKCQGWDLNSGSLASEFMLVKFSALWFLSKSTLFISHTKSVSHENGKWLPIRQEVVKLK